MEEPLLSTNTSCTSYYNHLHKFHTYLFTPTSASLLATNTVVHLLDQYLHEQALPINQHLFYRLHATTTYR